MPQTRKLRIPTPSIEEIWNTHNYLLQCFSLPRLLKTFKSTRKGLTAGYLTYRSFARIMAVCFIEITLAFCARILALRPPPCTHRSHSPEHLARFNHLDALRPAHKHATTSHFLRNIGGTAAGQVGLGKPLMPTAPPPPLPYLGVFSRHEKLQNVNTSFDSIGISTVLQSAARSLRAQGYLESLGLVV